MTAAAVTTAVCAIAAPGAPAITNGQADDGRHPWVGALVTHDDTGARRLICTGTLVSPTVFLTAAHCLEGEPADLEVSFDAFVGAPDVGPEVTLHAGRAHAHPLYKGLTKSGPTHDLGVVVLDEPLEDVPTARIAPVGTLDELGEAAQDMRWAVVGYGREGFEDGAFFGGGSRRYGFGSWRWLRRHTFQLMQRVSEGDAGTCNGDSGGPVFAGETRTVVGVASDGDPYCRKYGVSARVDTESARDFLDDHLR